MHIDEAQAIVEELRKRRVFAHLLHSGVGTAGIRIPLAGGREAVWDADDAAGLEAQVLMDGVLVGFVPVLPGSAEFTREQIVAAIAGADYLAGPGRE